MLGSRRDLHIFDAGSVNGTRYCNEILLPYVRLFRGAMGLQLLFIDDNAPCHRTVAAEQLLESEDIERMDWPARSPDRNPIEHIHLYPLRPTGTYEGSRLRASQCRPNAAFHWSDTALTAISTALDLSSATALPQRHYIFPQRCGTSLE
ncbi:transposable element Tcb2 transposase [Trichonephila clavipes]|nr:transposable element Tcb2 transposase [Trichonephila clavipes]